MSLAVLADHMASKGRGPDSMLIHMSPNEVQGLQALAMKHGGSLTINPDTGLPEAGFLDKLLPAIIGFAVTAATGLPAWQVGLGVGAVETARTGDLGKGISAGLGAYGGAGMGAGFGTAGSEAIGSQAAGQSYLSSYAPPGVLEGAGGVGAGLSADMAYNLGQAGVVDAASTQAASVAQQAAAERVAAATPYEKLVAGAKSIAENPSSALTKDNFKYMAAAAAPVLADQAVKSNMPTTTTKPGMVTPYSYFNGQFIAGNPYQATPTRAASGGIMGFDESSNSPMSHQSLSNMQDAGGMFNFAHDGGGVMKMAEGGIAGYADGGFTQDQINAALKTELAARGNTSQADLTNYAKSQYGLTDAQINAAYDTLPGFNAQGQWDKNDYLATHVPGQVDSQMVVSAARAADRAALGPGSTVVDPSGVTRQLTPYMPDFNKDDPYTLAMMGSKIGTGDTQAGNFFSQNPNYVQKAKDAWAVELERLNAIDRAAGRLPALGTSADANKGLAGLNQNLLTDTSKPPANETPAARDARLFQQAGGDWNKAAALRTAEDAALVASPDYWTDKKGLAALPAGSSDVDKWFAARGLGLSPIDTSINNFLTKYKPQLAAMTPKQQEDAMRAALNTEKMNEADVIRATGMTIAQLAAAKRADGSLVVAGNLEDVPIGSLPGGVSGAGNTVVNANGTITTRPDIPGIPEGGFTGMKDVRDAYTKGGGSLGYIPYTPKTIDEFNAKYKNTGGSKQGYDYLSGKADYTPTPYTKDGQIAKPYNESVLGMPVASSSKMYIFQNGKFVPNPAYAIPTYDKDGKKSSNLTNADVKAYMDKSPSTDAFYTWATTNNLSPEQIALASGRPINEISKLFTGAKELTDTEGKIDQTKVDEKTAKDIETNWDEAAYLAAHPDVKAELTTGKSVTGQPVQFTSGYEHWLKYGKDAKWEPTVKKAGGGLAALTMARGGISNPFFSKTTGKFSSRAPQVYADGGMAAGGQFDLGGYSDGGRLLRGPGDGVSDSIPATIGNKRPARLADGEFVVPARIVSELGNGSTEAGARKLYAMMDRVQAARKGSIGKGKVANNSRSDKYLPA